MTDSCPSAADAGSGSLNGAVAHERQYHRLFGGGNGNIDEAGCSFAFYLFGQQIHDVFGGEIVSEHGGLTVTLCTSDNNRQSEEEIAGNLHIALSDVFLILSSELDSVEFLG